MISTYLRLAWRNLLANKTVSLINIFGLSIAVACCIAVFLFLQNYWTLDSFHVHGERIFMVEYVTETDGEKQTWGDAPAPIASALAADFPQVERVVRMKREGVKLFNQENVFEEVLVYADTGFFAMFTFPLQYGNPAALADPNAIILSADMAQKYFGKEMPLGRTLMLVTDDQERKQFIVQGVAQPFPNNHGFAFNLLTGYHSVHKTLKAQDWKTGTSNYVFVQLRQPEDAAQLAQQMARYLAPFNAGNPEANIISFALDNLRNPMPGAYDVMRRPAEAPHPALTIMFSLIALTMMALSCFNYVNISLGGVSRRLKEIGIRKVMGGQREQLIAQFMSENLLLCFIALLFGLMLTEAFLIPLLNANMVLKTKFSFTDNVTLWLMLAGLLALTALASGAYPSLYVSSFKPVAIFTGRQKFSGKNVLRRGLLTAQFVLAFLAVIITVVLLTTVRVWEKLTWGYDPSQTLVVQLNDSQQFHLLRNEILKSPNVLRVAGSTNHVGQAWRPEIFQIGEAKQKASRYDVGADYQEALGLDLNAGRFFDSNRRVEDENAVVVNETFVRKQGWNEAIGKRVRIETKDYTIVGVAGDFKLFATGATRPALFFRAEENSFNFLVVRFAPGSGKQVAAQIEQDWQRLFPGMPVNRFFQTEVFDGFYQTSRKLAKSFGYIAGLALIIACMGLYGLAAQHFARRLKEVGVRKMLGASVAQILLLVNREFMFLLLAAGTFATALSVISVRLLLQEAERYVGNYAPGLGPFFLANLIVFLTAAIAVGRQSWNVTKVNPAEMLKNTE
ncbi:ABC transporter permease [candidate division KSB1 bacterium]|nr:ABC transporter permease [candidate division KSB1 bacterium]